MKTVMNYCGFFFNEDIKTVRYEKAKEQKQTNSSPVTMNLFGGSSSILEPEPNLIFSPSAKQREVPFSEHRALG